MNILLLNINIGKPHAWGGLEAHSETLGAYLHRRGHRLIMGCWTEDSVTVAGGQVLPSRRITIRNSGDVAAMLRMIRIIRSEGIQVVIANAGREYWPAAVAAAATGIRVVFVRHQLDPIRKTTRWLIAHRVDRIVAVSGAVKDVLLKSGIPPAKIEVIFNSIPLGKFDPRTVDRSAARAELGFGEDSTVIGTVGKLHRGKGVFELLQALDRLSAGYPSLKLLYVGEGTDAAGLREEVQRLGLDDRVVFAGLRRDIERMYASMDLFCLPSHNEGLPTVLVEAMAMERPVIATPVGGIPELIRDGDNGLLVPLRDGSALAAAVTRLLGDPVFCRAMALKGRQSVEHRFSDTAMGEQFERLLEDIAAPTSGTAPAGGALR